MIYLFKLYIEILYFFVKCKIQSIDFNELKKKEIGSKSLNKQQNKHVSV